jgi:hypothetical protein
MLKLTEEQWREVFRLRCKGKRGDRLDKLEQRLVEKAFKENSDRYGRMEADVFDATVPFGSVARYRR